MFTYRNRLGEVVHQLEVKASRDYRNAHPGSKRRDVLAIALIAGNVQGRSSEVRCNHTAGNHLAASDPQGCRARQNDRPQHFSEFSS